MATGADDPTATTSPDPGAPAAGPGADLTGRTLGDYRVLRRLGQGGMGQVYLAEQVSLRRRVALKILKAELAANPLSLQRFKAEAEAVARAAHANIVGVFGIDSADGYHYMALEYVEGRNLRDHLARRGPPEVPLALSIMRQVAAALRSAAEAGIIHRDVKPENILLTRKGEVKVADFGLSRVLAAEQPALNLTQSGVTMGTPLYMSPEQVEGKPLDPRTDVYSFGVTCYHMLAGQPPFRGQNAFEVALQHVRAEPEPLGRLRPDLPAELCAVVHKMMAKDPAARYQGCGELLQDLARLREALNGAPRTDLSLSGPVPLPAEAAESAAATGHVPATPAGPPAPRGRRWVPWLGAAAVLLALGGGAALGWLRLPGGSTPLPPQPLPSDAGDVKALFSPAEREQFLLTGVEEYANPENDPNRLQMGLGHGIELGLFYLEQHRLDDAERFFGRLDSSAQRVPRYRDLGRLGKAIVWALQDRPAESNEVFLQFWKETKGSREKLEQALFLNRNPRLRMWVGRALDYNAENASTEQPFPAQLEFLRQPPAPRRPEKPPGGRGA
jgi:serine/threonine-protein kinase